MMRSRSLAISPFPLLITTLISDFLLRTSQIDWPLKKDTP